MTLKKQPKKMTCCWFWSYCNFAYFYNSMGTEVTVSQDEEVSKHQP